MLGGQDHDHVPALKLRVLLDHCHLLERIGKAVQLQLAPIEVDHLPTAEHHRHLRLVPLLQESLSVLGLKLEVVILGLGPELDLFDLNDRLFLPRLSRLLALLVSVLPVIDDPADRRLGFRRHLHQIERQALGDLQGLLNREDSELFPIRINDSNLFDPNPLVDPDTSTDGCSLLRIEAAPPAGGLA